MKIKMFQVDAFTRKLFGGNPAAVCLLDSWISDELMQSIAAENNPAETAFVLKRDIGYNIRWFTPLTEVDLCGHATLASAHVIFNCLAHSTEEIIFSSLHSGILKVKKSGELLTLDFPSDELELIETPQVLSKGLGRQPVATYRGKTDLMAVFSTEQEILDIQPDFDRLATVASRGVIVTARGKTVDFVSRFFAPQSGINEDPVTGSAHTSMIPYWAKILGKNEMTAIQLSSRKGHLICKYNGDRVEIGGYAVTYLTGEIVVG